MTDRVKLISFHSANFGIIRSLTELGGDTIALEYLSKAPDADAIGICKKYNADFGAKYIGVTEAQVRQLHSMGLKVNVWTLGDYLDAYHMVHSLKVDALTTDYMFFR